MSNGTLTAFHKMSLGLMAAAMLPACDATQPVAPPSEQTAGLSIPASAETTRQTGVTGYQIAGGSATTPSRLTGFDARGTTIATMWRAQGVETVSFGGATLQFKLGTHANGSELRLLRPAGDFVVTASDGQQPVVSGLAPTADEQKVLTAWQLFNQDLQSAQIEYSASCGYCIRQYFICINVEAIALAACASGNLFACAGGLAGTAACWNGEDKDCHNPCPCGRDNAFYYDVCF